MKKIGLTLRDEEHDFIKQIAEKNKLSVTTICSLILRTRLSWYIKQNHLPEFKTFTIEIQPKKEETNLTQPFKEINESNCEHISDEETEKLMKSIMGEEEQKQSDDELPF